MGIIAVTNASAPAFHEVSIQRLGETQWIDRRGNARIFLTLQLRFGGTITSNEEPDPPSLDLYVPYKVTDIQDTSDNWLDPPNVEYFSNTSGYYYRLVDIDSRTIRDRSGLIHVNGASVTQRAGRTRGGIEVRERTYACLHIQLTGPVRAFERHMIQIRYNAVSVALRKGRLAVALGSNWHFANRYFSVYDFWDSVSRAPAEDLPEDKLLAVHELDNWVSLPGRSRPERFAPAPVMESFILVDHPGAFGSAYPIRSQAICRFNIVGVGAGNPWFAAHTYGEYTSQPIPSWVVYSGLLLAIVGVVLTLVV